MLLTSTLLFLFQSGAVHSPASASAVAAADRGRACGLGAEFHAGRRAELRRRLGSGVVVMRGLADNREYREFRQDKSFWYLTGVESRDAALVMDAASGREVLFLPAADKELAREEMWNGEIWDASDDWVAALSGFDEIRPGGELLAVVEAMLADAESERVVWISRYAEVGLAESSDRAAKFDAARRADPLDGRGTRTDALQTALADALEGIAVRDFGSELIEMRVEKTDLELAVLRRAAAASCAAMNEAIRSTEPGVGEWELDALMSFVHELEGGEGPAYEAIVGSGPNALILHYLASDRVLREGEMMLVDYACELEHYTCDVTRSWPTSGEFTPRMAELYDAVLAAQAAGIAAARPGTTLSAVSAACQDVLKERGFAKYVRHGACHFVGMEVHDPGPFVSPLRPGACFTIEPGLYDPEAGIGIRIEDVVVITAEGCEVITAAVPKERAEIVRLRDEPGLLQGVRAR